MSCKLIYHVVLKHKHSHTFGEEIVLKVEANTLYEAFVRSNFECLEKYPNYELSSISPPSGLEEKTVIFKNQKHMLELFELQSLHYYTELQSSKEFLIKPDFYVGQEFWVIKDNKPIKGEITKIEVTLQDPREYWLTRLFFKRISEKNMVVENFVKYYCTINKDKFQILYDSGCKRYIVTDLQKYFCYGNVFTEYEHLVEFMKKDLDKKLKQC